MIPGNDTIAAIATAPGPAGVGIIRISGPKAFAAGSGIFRKKIDGPFDSHRLYYGQILHPDSGEILDEALFVFMKGPRSFTGEDVVEIQAHGGSFHLARILSLLMELGARLAEPGEFTRRAVLAGRMDLTQAEGLMDLVEAESLAACKMGVALLRGDLGAKVRALKEKLLELCTGVAAEIDFPEDVGEIVDTETVFSELENFYLAELSALIREAEDGMVLREGLRLVIAGAPNVGKSSIMNRLLEKERSIVTDIPGTTRDLVEESFKLAGRPLVLTDTAGIRETEDAVESIGVSLAKEKILEADLVLLVLDASRPPGEAEEKLVSLLQDHPYLLLLNKKDLAETGTFSLPSAWKPEAVLPLSAKTGEGLDALKHFLAENLAVRQAEHAALPNLRHREAFIQAHEALTRVRDGLFAGDSWDLLSVDLNLALNALGKILGEEPDPDLLDQVFSRFCIGK